ncbi:MAG: dockerin type I repeat-containing protein, partial [Oscillospiraceae bacterium]|nr:dockerin type I repeat-containing protein [Oscillospiraceae bacterium]
MGEGAIDTLLSYFERVDGIPDLPAETEPPAVTTTTVTTTTAAATTTAMTTTDKTAILRAVLIIEQLPYKTIYRVGEPLDLTGGLVAREGEGAVASGSVYHWQESQIKMTDSSLISVDTSHDFAQEPGEYTINLTECEGGKASFGVQVIAKDAGDVNLDGKITMDDYDMIETDYTLQMVGMDSQLTDAQMVNADVDGDGEVDMVDAALVEKIAEHDALLAEHAAEFTTPAVTATTVSHTETV